MRILTALLRYDYGDPKRGESLEKSVLLPAIEENAEVYPFWLEDHGFPSNIEGLQAELFKAAEHVDPDLIFFILMKDEVRPATLAKLSTRWATANWFADDQWRFESFTRHVAPLLTYSITVDKFCLPKYQSIGCKRVIYSQWASSWEPFEGKPEDYAYDVSFIGGRNSVREWYIHQLMKSGILVQCFGAGWPAGRVTFEEMRKIVRYSKISLNLSNSQPSDSAYFIYSIFRFFRAIIGREKRGNSYFVSIRRALSGIWNFLRSEKRVEQIKARNFEIPAWGGFQISQFALGIEDYFVPGKEIVLFSSPHELATLVSYFLVNENERETIRGAGNARASEHTYAHRFASIIKEIETDKG